MRKTGLALIIFSLLVMAYFTFATIFVGVEIYSKGIVDKVEFNNILLYSLGSSIISMIAPIYFIAKNWIRYFDMKND